VNLATQDRDLVAQNQKLDVLGAAVAGELGQHLQDLTQQEVNQRGTHGLIIEPSRLRTVENRTSRPAPSSRAPQVIDDTHRDVDDVPRIAGRRQRNPYQWHEVPISIFSIR